MRKAMFFTSPYYEHWAAGDLRYSGAVNLGSHFSILRAAYFSEDGSQFYVAGEVDGESGSNWIVRQYTTPKRNRVYPALTYTAQKTLTHLPTSSAAKVRAICFGDSGTKFYVLCNIGDWATSADNAVYQYNLSTAWDISTASYAGKSFATDTVNINISGLAFKSDGAKFFLSTSNRRVYECSMATAWDVSTASFVNTKYASARFSTSLFLRSDGLVAHGFGARIVKNVMTSAFDILHLIAEEQSEPVLGAYGTASHDGSCYVVLNQSTDKKLYQYLPLKNIARTLAYGPNAELVGYEQITSQMISADSVVFSADGAYLYVLGKNSGGNWGVAQYSLTDDWTILGGLSFVAFKPFTHTFRSATPRDIAFSADGTKLYVCNNTLSGSSSNNKIHQYNLATAWDISTAAYSNKSFATDVVEERIRSLFFKDGTTFFAYGSLHERVYKLTLSTAWDISTASYGGVYKGEVFDENRIGNRIRFKADGTKMFLFSSSPSITPWALSTAWDITTASAGSTVTLYGTGADGGVYSQDGTKVVTCHNANNKVFLFEHRLTN